MLETYSLNVEVATESAIPFNNVTLKKGCTVTKSAPNTVELNKCGVYMISFDGSSEEATIAQLYKDGVAQPQAQSTGLNPSFVTLVQVDHNNCDCPCASPTIIEIRNEEATTATYTNANLVITKVV